MARPISTIRIARPRISDETDAALAPMANRIPISRVRLWTVCDISANSRYRK